MSKVKPGRDWVSRQLSDDSVRLSFDQERAVHEFIEQFDMALRQKELSRADVARLLGRSAPSITQALKKGRNLSIKLMTELAGICDHEVHVRLRPRSATGGPVYIKPERDWSAIHSEDGVPDCDVSNEALLFFDVEFHAVARADVVPTKGTFQKHDAPDWDPRLSVQWHACGYELSS